MRFDVTCSPEKSGEIVCNCIIPMEWSGREGRREEEEEDGGN